MISTLNGFQGAPALNSTSTLGTQLAVAAAVVGVDSSDRIDQALAAASFFADCHDFYLPQPNMRNGSDPFAQFRSETVPVFQDKMRFHFGKQIYNIGGKGVYERFKAEGLFEVSLPDVALAGLLSFDSTSALLEGVAEDLDDRIEAIGTFRPSKNPYYSARALVGRGILHGVALGTALYLIDDSMWALGAFGLWFKAVEALTFIKGRRSKARQFAENRARAAQLDELRSAREQLRLIGARLDKVKDRIPNVGEITSFDTVNMRRVAIHDKLRGRDASFEIVDGRWSLLPFEGEYLKYVAVEMADGSTEVRVMTPKPIHPILVLDGDKIVGAGYLLYRGGNGAKGPAVYIDGKSTSYPTYDDEVQNLIFSETSTRQGLGVVAETLRGVLGRDIAIDTVKTVYAID